MCLPDALATYPLWRMAPLGCSTPACLGTLPETNSTPNLPPVSTCRVCKRNPNPPCALNLRACTNTVASQVENAFYKASGVIECTAIGVPDARLGEDIAVMIYTKELNASSTVSPITPVSSPTTSSLPITSLRIASPPLPALL